MPHRTHGHSPALPLIGALVLTGCALFATSVVAAPSHSPAVQQRIEQQRAIARVQQGDLRALRDLSRARAEIRFGALGSGGSNVVQGGGPPTALYVAFDDDRAVGEGYLAKFDAAGQPASGWPAFGLPVIAGAQVAFEHQSIDDGAGGRIVGWKEYGIGPTRIRAQRINAAAVRQWGASGAMVSPSYDDGFLWQMIPDGSGGAFFAWEATAGGVPVIRAQHVNSAGAIATDWPDTGVVLGAVGTTPGIPHVASDGVGGAYVTWSDITTELVYAQHLDASATPQFSPAEGRPFSFIGHNHSVSQDAAGGLTIAWQGGDDIFVARFDTGGTPTWGDSGVVVCDEPSQQFNPQVQSDGSDGVLIGWFDRREDPLAIYALRLDSNGAPVSGWPEDGARVGSNDPSEFGWIPDGLGGGFFALSTFSFGSGYWGHSLQHLLSDGGIAFGFGADGIVLATQAGVSAVTMSLDGGGGVLAAWLQPDTYGGTAGLDLYGQHVDIGGAGTWGAGNPLLLSTNADGRQGLPSVVQDGSGGAHVGFLQLNGSPTGLDAMFRRINQSGAPQGPTIPVAYGPEVVDAFTMVPDAPNRAIALWGVAGPSSHDIHAQRYSNLGAPLWAPGGITITTGASGLGFGGVRIPAAPDGASGVVVGWSNTDVTLQRIDSTGTARWGPAGATAFTGVDGSLLVTERDVQPADAHGAFVNATVFENGVDGVTRWCVQKLDGNGNRLWGTNGYELANDSLGGFSVSASAIAPDGTGGVYAAWQFGIFPGDENRSIRVVRILSSGTLAPGWPAEGVEVRNGFTSGVLAGLAPDGLGNVVATWMEFRGGRIGSYAQLIDASGAIQWNGPGPGDVANGVVSDGVALSLDNGIQVLPLVATDGVGGAVFTWLDGRGTSWDIYAQRINAAGDRIWGATALGVSTDAEVQGRLALVSDGASGALIAWADGGTRPADVIQIARVTAAGTLAWNSSGVVATLASLQSAQVVDGIARLAWTTPEPAFRARLERRTLDGDWQTLGDVRVDGTGWIRAEDATIQRGVRYGYRLVTNIEGVDQPLGEVWLDVPNVLAFALQGMRPNPANGPLMVSFTLPKSAPARIEVLDIAGRRVLAREVGSLGAGSHVLNLGEPSRMGPGLYFLRLTQGADRRDVRFSRVR